MSKAEKRYEVVESNIRNQINELKEQIRKHNNHFAFDNKNWGYVGSFEHVLEGLIDLNRFLRGEESEG